MLTELLIQCTSAQGQWWVVGGHTLQLEGQAETTRSRLCTATTPSTARLDSHWKHEAKDQASRSSQTGM